VTRATISDLARDAGYEVVEGVYPLSELVAAEEAFTTSSVREVMPVVQVDVTAIPRGAAADELQGALRREATLPS
jgi:branched-subunit amino acid aminotransferase/4-amino-4-deoxychorismate lyase